MPRERTKSEPIAFRLRSELFLRFESLAAAEGLSVGLFAARLAEKALVDGERSATPVSAERPEDRRFTGRSGVEASQPPEPDEEIRADQVVPAHLRRFMTPDTGQEVPPDQEIQADPDFQGEEGPEVPPDVSNRERLVAEAREVAGEMDADRRRARFEALVAEIHP